MGVIEKIEENNCIIAIWDMRESYEKLLQLSNNYDLSKYKTEKRKREFLASRLLLNEIQPNQQITYNKYGAPEIKNGNYISISHSKNLVVIVASEQKAGIDIEQISEQPLRLSSKFIAENTHQDLSKEKATLIWCCKEAVFKWHQKGSVDLINDIRLNQFELKEKGEIECCFHEEILILKYHKINNHYLVYVCK